MPTLSNFFRHPEEIIIYNRALNDAEIQNHFQDHPTLKQITPNNDAEITYTNTPVISPVDPSTLNTYSDALLWLRGGDAPGDSSTALENVVGANSFPASMPKTSGTTSLVFTDIGSNKGAFLQSNDSQNAFNNVSPFTISGWFKTVDTGTLFSNTSTVQVNNVDVAVGLHCEIAADGEIELTTQAVGVTPITRHTNFVVNDGEWHHIIVDKSASNAFRIYIDGNSKHNGNSSTITDAELKGSNGFTLLGDGLYNTNATTINATDPSKLNASLSNWSIHKEIFDIPTIQEIYSYGQVRNLKNLIGVDTNLIEAWWSLSDLTSPGQDLISTKDLVLVDKSVTATLNGKAIKASTLTSSSTLGTRDFAVVGNKNPFANDNNMPNLDDAFTISFWLNIPSQGTTWDSILGFSATDTRNHFKIHNIGTGLSFSFAGAGEGADYTIDYSGKFNAWHHVVMIKPQGTVQNLEIFVDGIRYAVTQTYDTSNYLDPATSSWGAPGTATAQTIGEFFLFGNGRAYNSSSSGVYGSNRTGRVFMIDELATYAGVLTHNTNTAGQAATGQVYEIWNNGSYVDLSSLSGLNLVKYFKFGDHSSDVNSGTLQYFDEVNDTAYFASVNNTNGGTHTLAGTESFYKLAPANLVNNLENAVGAVSNLEEDQYGSGITMSITKRFDPVNFAWTNTHTYQACICLSFNGFEDRAEYYAIYKYNTLDIADNDWHNIILSFSGKNGSSTNTTTNLSFSSSAHNIVVSFDGNVVNDAVFVGGLRGVPVVKLFQYLTDI